MRSVEECYRGKKVRVFRLDRDAVLRELRRRARELVAARPEVIEVRLFGSLARGEARPGSDADVWVLLEESSLGFLERSAALASRFERVGVACEVVAYTEAEWERLRDERRRIVRIVAEEGIVLASRRSS